MMTEYGSEILAERSRRRVTQQAVAEKAGIATATLVDIEYDRIAIAESTFKSILAAIREVEAEANEQAAA